MPMTTEHWSKSGSITRRIPKEHPNPLSDSIPMPASPMIKRTLTIYSPPWQLRPSHSLRQPVHHPCSQAIPHANQPIRPDHPVLLTPSRWALKHSKCIASSFPFLKQLPNKSLPCMLSLSILRCALRAARVQGSHIASQAGSHVAHCLFIHHPSHYYIFLKSYIGVTPNWQFVSHFSLDL